MFCQLDSTSIVTSTGIRLPVMWFLLFALLSILATTVAGGMDHDPRDFTSPAITGSAENGLNAEPVSAFNLMPPTPPPSDCQPVQPQVSSSDTGEGPRTASAAGAVITQHMKERGLEPLHKAGLYDRLGGDAAAAGFRYVGDEKSWVLWDKSVGCYTKASDAKIQGFLFGWIQSKPLSHEKETILTTIPMGNNPIVQQELDNQYTTAEKIVTSDLSWRNSAAKIISGHPRVLTHSEDYDLDPEVVNCLNGYLNLRSMEFTKHTQNGAVLFRRCVACEFDPEAPCPRWLQYLNESHPEDQNRSRDDQLIPFLQYVGGTAAIGRMAPHRAGFWIHGPTKTGKSVFANTLYTVLGSYATTLDKKLLMQTRNGSRMEDTLAKLPGMRLVCVNEVPDGLVNDAMFKSLTSSDPMAVREMYESGQVVKFTHSFIATTNHQPVINDSGGAVFDRLQPIPFNQVVATPDSSLEAKLQQEASGILNWIIAGARMVLENPNLYLRPPAIVSEGVEEYRKEMDVIGSFIEECCDIVPETQQIATDSLFDIFKLWAKRSNQLARITRNRFISMMKEAGYKFDRYGSSGGKRLRGVAGLSINSIYRTMLREQEHLAVESTSSESVLPFNTESGFQIPLPPGSLAGLDKCPPPVPNIPIVNWPPKPQS